MFNGKKEGDIIVDNRKIMYFQSCAQVCRIPI